MIENALIICDGNVCRSPMAMALWAQAIPQVPVSSAGLIALAGRPAARHAITVMQVRGCDLSGHIAQAVHLGLVRDAQLILVMTRVQQRELQRRYPFTRGRVFLIDQTEGCDVDDPVGQPAPTFDAVAIQLERAVSYWAARFSHVVQEGVAV